MKQNVKKIFQLFLKVVFESPMSHVKCFKKIIGAYFFLKF